MSEDTPTFADIKAVDLNKMAAQVVRTNGHANPEYAMARVIAGSPRYLSRLDFDFEVTPGMLSAKVCAALLASLEVANMPAAKRTAVDDIKRAQQLMLMGAEFERLVMHNVGLLVQSVREDAA